MKRDSGDGERDMGIKREIKREIKALTDIGNKASRGRRWRESRDEVEGGTEIGGEG